MKASHGRVAGLIGIVVVAGGLAVVHGSDDERPGPDTGRIAVPAAGTVTIREDFESTPTAWDFPAGTWAHRVSDGGGVLAQTATDRTFPLALWKMKRFADVDVSVRFRPISGRIDASGGIVFRARDGRNYYVVRANSLENNFRLYTVIDGRRSKIAGTSVDPPALGQWHTLRVAAAGSHIQAYLDGALLINHRDDTYSAGWVGLWTKADAVTEFDDLVVTGAPTSGE